MSSVAQTTQPVKDPLLQIHGSLNAEQLTLLTQRISEYLGEICLCMIQHQFTTRRQITFGFIGPSHDSDFIDERHNHLRILLWKAEHPPQPQPYGMFSIPAEHHFGAGGELHSWFNGRGTGQDLDYRIGAVQDPLLTNEPFGLSPEFTLSPDETKPSLEDIMRNILEKRVGPGTIWVGFFIGVQRVSRQLIGYQWSKRRFLSVTQAIRHLGCQLGPILEAEELSAVIKLKADICRQVANALSRGESQAITLLRRDYQNLFGEELTHLPLSP